MFNRCVESRASCAEARAFFACLLGEAGGKDQSESRGMRLHKKKGVTPAECGMFFSCQDTHERCGSLRCRQIDMLQPNHSIPWLFPFAAWIDSRKEAYSALLRTSVRAFGKRRSMPNAAIP